MQFPSTANNNAHKADNSHEYNRRNRSRLRELQRKTSILPKNYRREHTKQPHVQPKMLGHNRRGLRHDLPVNGYSFKHIQFHLQIRANEIHDTRLANAVWGPGG